MDKEKFKEDHANLIESVGGYSAVRNRLLMQRVYSSLYFRTNSGTESVNMVTGAQYLKFMYSIDLYTESGISKLKIPPHSCFDLKDTIVTDSIYRISKFAETYIHEHPGAKVFLLYNNPGALTDQVLREVKKQKFVDVYQVDEFLQKVEKVAKIQDQIERQERDWRTERESIIESARFSYREDHCTFFLGAGVSISAGGPSWEMLLRKIIQKYKTVGKQSDFNKIYECCGMSPIILGRYVASDKKMLERISEYLQRYVLYKNVRPEDSDLIKAICEAVVGPGNDERIAAAGGVESIITYNYDDMVETALEKCGIQTARVYLKNRIKKDEFPIYHVHGIIPQEKQDIISTPILGEKEYHQIYRESYQWSNVEQLHALDRNTCFFVGLSMTDPNLRRLLDISRSGSDNDYQHFAFLQRKPLFKPEEVHKNDMHFRTIEFQLSDLGVQVIWYENHSEIPGFIRRIIAPMRYIG